MSKNSMYGRYEMCRHFCDRYKYIILPQRWDCGFESVLGHYLVCSSPKHLFKCLLSFRLYA